MTTTAPTYEGLTAEQWREKAAECSRRSQESFDRCDTDGFLSQWASDSTASKYHSCAALAEQGGMWDFRAFFTLAGEYVPTREVETAYGLSYGIIDPANPRGRFLGFINPSKASTPEKRRAAMEKKGYRKGFIRCEAKVIAHSPSPRSYSISYPKVPVEGSVPLSPTIVSTDDLAAY